jgi:hypothetical protein
VEGGSLDCGGDMGGNDLEQLEQLVGLAGDNLRSTGVLRLWDHHGL